MTIYLIYPKQPYMGCFRFQNKAPGLQINNTTYFLILNIYLKQGMV